MDLHFLTHQDSSAYGGEPQSTSSTYEFSHTPKSKTQFFSISMLMNNSGHERNSQSAKKRFRRRHDQVLRHYTCSHPGCDKSYGTLNHLNSHIIMQNHGEKQTPSQYRDLRLLLRRQRRLQKASIKLSKSSSSKMLIKNLLL